MTTDQRLVLDAFDADKATHVLGTVYGRLLREAELGSGLGNGALAKALDLSLVTMRRTLGILSRLGLVLPVTTRKSGFQTILVNAEVGLLTRAILAGLGTGVTTIDVRQGLVVFRGELVDLRWSLPDVELVAAQNVEKSDGSPMSIPDPKVITHDHFDPKVITHDQSERSPMISLTPNGSPMITLFVRKGQVGVGFLPKISEPLLYTTYDDNKLSRVSTTSVDTTKSNDTSKSFRTSSKETQESRQLSWLPSDDLLKTPDPQQTQTPAALLAPAPAVSAGTKGKPTPEEQAFLDRLWLYWQTQMGYLDRKMRMGSARVKLALARYREGRTIEEFEAVIRWASTDPWLRGKDPKSTRKFDDYSTLFRPSNFDKYLKNAGDAKRHNVHDPEKLAARDGPVTGRWIR